METLHAGWLHCEQFPKNQTSLGMAGSWGRMNPQEITWLQHAVLVIKGKKSVVTVAYVSARTSPAGITEEVSWRMWCSHKDICHEISSSFGQLPGFPEVLLMQEFWQSLVLSLLVLSPRLLKPSHAFCLSGASLKDLCKADSSLVSMYNLSSQLLSPDSSVVPPLGVSHSEKLVLER